jgi:hypothetical protein
MHVSHDMPEIAARFFYHNHPHTHENSQLSALRSSL